MTLRLIDSDIAVDLLRSYPPAVNWLDSVNVLPGMPGHVMMELIRGCGNADEVRIVRSYFNHLKFYWPSSEDCNRAVNSYSAGHLSHSLGIIDALIGETAVGLDAILYSFNTKHMRSIPHLKIEQPYPR